MAIQQSKIYLELSRKIDPELVEELLSSYIKIKSKFFEGQPEEALSVAGKFCETTLKCLLFLNEDYLQIVWGLSLTKFLPRL